VTIDLPFPWGKIGANGEFLMLTSNVVGLVTVTLIQSFRCRSDRLRLRKIGRVTNSGRTSKDVIERNHRIRRKDQHSRYVLNAAKTPLQKTAVPPKLGVNVLAGTARLN